MKIAIIGAGILGISLGYFLSAHGVEVEIYEASSEIGGLAGPFELDDGTVIDRYYHAILSSDCHLVDLCKELAIDDQLRFRQTKMAFYYRGATYSMNNIFEFLRFPPLNWLDRFRLGLTILAAQSVRDWRQLETISVEEWLLRWSGRTTYENIWRPLLRAKFDGAFDAIPATWIWSRLVRMQSTREGANQKEQAGHIIGGYTTLLQAMVAKIEAVHGRVHLATPVQEIIVHHGCASAIRTRDAIIPFDAIVATVQTSLLSRLMPDGNELYQKELCAQEYLGVICPVLILNHPLTGYWTLNIADDGYPFTGVIETTAYIDSTFVGGHHLVYLPKYTAPGSSWQNLSDDEIRSIWMQNLLRMFPDFEPSSVQHFIVNRSRQVEPIHYVGGAAPPLSVNTPVRNLYLATTSQIYPELSNGEAATRHARRVADMVLLQLPSVLVKQMEAENANV